MKLLIKARILLYSTLFNFRVLPFRQAMKMPFCCYVCPTVKGNGGTVIFDCSRLKRYMIKIGLQKTYPLSSRSFLWSNNGTIVFKGKCQIGYHSLIQVHKNGCLEFGDQVGLNSGCRIVSQKKIVFGTKVRAAWDCQFYDTDFHPLIDMINGEAVKMKSPIIIGNNVWIGHNVIISKGVKLADGSIVSSGSVVKNIFKTPNCIISGNPAIKVSDGYTSIFPDF